MRITMCLLFVAVFHLFAVPTDAQNSMLKLPGNQLTVGELIDEIEEQTTYLVIFSNNEIDIDQTIRLKEKSGRVSDYLNEVFKKDDINYRFENNYIILSKSSVIPGVQQDRIQISGTVIDENRDPVIGANIREEGTQNGTITHVDGSFTLTVSPQATLTVTYIGYQSQRIQVAGRTTFLIELNEDTQALEEVVIVGYGVQKKVNLTGSVASVKAEEIQDIPASNLSNALSGKLAGVFIKQRGGRPGVNSDVTVRAQGTWNNTEPLYVIDGVVRDQFAFDGLDASEVENLSVLKDGASAAIYGARAANGVILVTTKKGQVGKPVISYTGSVGFSDATKIPKTQNGYNQAIFTNDYLRVENVDTSDSRYYSADELEFFRNNNWNWLDEAWKEPVITRHTLNVSGGNERVRYFIGGSYYYETGSFDNLDFKKYSLRSSVEANITKNLKASLNVNMDVRNDNKPYWRYDNDSDTMSDLYKALLFRTGQVPPYVDGLPTGSYVEWHPLEIIADHTGYNRKKYSNYEANIGLQYDVPFLEGLSLKFQYNKYNRHTFIKQFNRPYDLYEFRMTGEHNHIITNEVATVKTRNDGDFLNEKYDTQDSYQLNAYVTYSQSFGKHDVGGLFVFEQSEGTINWFEGRVNNFISSAVDEMFAGSSDAKNSTVDGKAEEYGRISYVGRLNYGYAEKYLLEASFRYDGSVIFAPKNRWGFFPSASAAWRISEENFFRDNVRFMNYLKLRASIGLLGNDDVGGWQWMQRYKFVSGAHYGSLSDGLEAEVIPNEQITWEKSLTYNVGFDTKFLNNRLSFDFDAFYRHTYDILGERDKSLPTTFGAKMPKENYAVIDAKGFEIELGYADKIGPDFRYYVKGNMAYAVNKVKTKDEAENLRPYKSEIGYSTDRKMGYIATGIIRTQGELDALPEDYTIFGQKPELGMLNYKDLRGANSDEPDGRIDDDDKDWIINHTNPPVNYGVSLGGSWRGLSLDIFLQGVAGNDIMIGQRGSQARPQETNFDFWTDHWTPENPNASFPRASRNAAGEESTFWVRDGSFLRLKNISLSYSFPNEITSKLKVSQLKVFLMGNNVCLLQNKLKYYDPENSSINAYPLMKSYSFGVNLSF